MALKIEKPWGLPDHPWLPFLVQELPLWVTPGKKKVKIIETKKLTHFSTLIKFKHIQ